MNRSSLSVLSLLGFSLVASLAVTGCKKDPERPNVPGSVLGDDNSFSPRRSAAEAEGSAPEEAPARPVIVHDAPPAPADFAPIPVVGDWLGWRGNFERSGLREARAIHTPKVLWSIKVGIQGYSNTPIVTDDAIYVSSQGERYQIADEADGLYRLDPATGAIVWHFHTPHDSNGAALIGGTLFVGTDGRTIHGVDPATGAERWKIEQDCQIYHGPTEVDGRALYIRSGVGNFISIDPATGSVQGDLACIRSERGALSSHGELIGWAGANDLAVLDAQGQAWLDEAVVETYKSRTRWSPPSFTASMLIDSVNAWPFGEAGALRLRQAAVARWADNGQVAWVAEINDSQFANPEGVTEETPFLRSAPWVANDRVFWTPTNVGALVAFDSATGERLESVSFPDCRSRSFGSIVGTPTVGYLARHDGVLYGFSTAPLRILWSYSMGLHGAAGRRTTHFPVQGPCSAEPRDGSALFSTPAIGADGTLYVGSGDGWIYAIADSDW